MKRAWALFLLLLLLPALCLNALAEETELLENGGFEILDDTGRPEGWYTNAYHAQEGYSRLTVTTEEARSGQYSVLVENATANDARFICTVNVKPNTMYRLSGYVLVSSMEDVGNGANFAIEDIYSVSECLYDTGEEWQRIEWYGLTGDSQTSVTIGVRVGGYSAESVGKAYFDDLSLVEVTSLPQGVVADLWYKDTTPAPSAASNEAQTHTLWLVLIDAAFLLALLMVRPLLKSREHPASNVIFGIFLAICLMLRVIIALTVSGYEVDINCFLSWGTRMAQVGPTEFYAADYFCDYPPGFLLLLWPFGWLMNAANQAGTGVLVLLVKALPILCDLLGAMFLYTFAKKRLGGVPAIALAMLYALNPATLVNGAAWGQMDSVLALLLLLVTGFAIRREWQAAIPLYVLALLIKPQALLVAPIGGAYLLVCFLQKQEPAQRRKEAIHALWGLGLAVAVAAAVVMPFAIHKENPLVWLFDLYRTTTTFYSYATINTANLYYLAGANWASLSQEAPGLLCALTALLSGVCGVWLMLRGPVQIKRRSTAIAVLCLVLCGVQVALWAFGATYGTYGYLMMGFAFLYALLCLIYDPRPETLPFTMALALIGVYMLGCMVHERYLFPALPLLIMGYTLTRDKRLLLLCGGLSATTFLNVSIILDNAIVLGAQQGHLNNDTMALNIILCILNLLLLLYAGYIGLTGLRPSPERKKANAEETTEDPSSYRDMLLHPGDARMRLGAKDYLIMGVTTALYAALAFTNLGSTVAPQTAWVSTSADEQVVLELEDVQTFSMLYYAGVCDNDFSISISQDGLNWSEPVPCRMRQGLCYRWLYALRYDDSGSTVEYTSDSPENVLWFTGKYLRIHAQAAGLNLWEVVLRDKEGNNLPVTVASHTGAKPELLNESKPAENLIDEQDTCIGEPSWYNGTYFDEIYYARTAYEHLHGQSPYENTHPPLGKLLIAAGIALFGMTPFGWRFAGTLIGVLMLPALYLLGMQLSKRRSIATMSMLAFALDLMHYTQTRIATIDSFPVFFIILTYWFMVRYLQTDLLKPDPDAQPRLLSRAYLKSLIPLALCGIAMGLSIASKWIGLYSAVGLAVLFFTALYRQYRASNVACGMDTEALEGEARARVITAQRYTLSRALFTCGACLIFFVAIPAAIYYASYVPFLSPTGKVTWQRVIAAQQVMLSYHSKPGLGMDHAFYSPWWQWPFILKPMWFAQDSYEPAGYASTIMCMGNPWVFYLGAVAMLAVLIAWVGKYMHVKNGSLRLRQGDGDLTLPVLGIGFLAQFLPWALVPRGTYMYHYFASVPFIILATTWLLDRYAPKNPKQRFALMAVYVAGAAVFFVKFFPYASGWLCSTEWLDAMKWFSKLYY